MLVQEIGISDAAYEKYGVNQKCAIKKKSDLGETIFHR